MWYFKSAQAKNVFFFKENHPVYFNIERRTTKKPNKVDVGKILGASYFEIQL